ncbi:MAG: hypothetical protein AAFY64_08985, partial [Pseudomonadota bacterium]
FRPKAVTHANRPAIASAATKSAAKSAATAGAKRAPTQALETARSVSDVGAPLPSNGPESPNEPSQVATPRSQPSASPAHAAHGNRFADTPNHAAPPQAHVEDALHSEPPRSPTTPPTLRPISALGKSEARSRIVTPPPLATQLATADTDDSLVGRLQAVAPGVAPAQGGNIGQRDARVSELDKSGDLADAEPVTAPPPLPAVVSSELDKLSEQNDDDTTTRALANALSGADEAETVNAQHVDPNSATAAEALASVQHSDEPDAVQEPTTPSAPEFETQALNESAETGVSFNGAADATASGDDVFEAPDLAATAPTLADTPNHAELPATTALASDQREDSSAETLNGIQLSTLPPGIARSLAKLAGMEPDPSNDQAEGFAPPDLPALLTPRDDRDEHPAGDGDTLLKRFRQVDRAS